MPGINNQDQTNIDPNSNNPRSNIKPLRRARAPAHMCHTGLT